MAGNGWNGLKWLEGFELLEMAGIAGNGWKWLELTGNGWKQLKNDWVFNRPGVARGVLKHLCY